MSLSDTNAETGGQDKKFEIPEMESFDTSDSSSDPGTRRSTFESSYTGVSDRDTFQPMSLFEDREKAVGIIEEAQKKATEIESKAYEKGFAQGEKDGLEMGAKKLEKIFDRIHGILEDMVAYRGEFVKKYEKEMLRLVSAVAGKVVHGTAKVDNRIVRETILEAFSLAADRSKVTVRINPEEIEYVKEIRPEFFDRISELKSITIESDPSISLGGCFMETAFGNVDGQVETQLDKIANAVERVFEEENVGDVNREPERGSPEPEAPESDA